MSDYPPSGPQYGGNPDPNQPNPAGSYPPPGNFPPPPAFDNSAYGAGTQLPGGGQPGSLGARFAARFIDGIIVSIIAFIIYLIVGGGTFGQIVLGIVSAVLGFAYFTFLESSRGQTVGKQLLGLRTLGAAGGHPTQAEAAKRNSWLLLNIIPFLGGLLVLIAYIVIAVTINSSPSKQGKHDEFAGGTQVIKTS